MYILSRIYQVPGKSRKDFFSKYPKALHFSVQAQQNGAPLEDVVHKGPGGAKCLLKGWWQKRQFLLMGNHG